MCLKRALISVSNKSGLVSFARSLQDLGIEILSTGGTSVVLRESGIAVVEVSEFTGFPEIMNGRVKTLHPKIHGGILGRRGQDDGVMVEHGIAPIDLVVVNLYPFADTIVREDCTLDLAIENIDVGGPAMLRAAAKNHQHVGVIVDPQDYERVIVALRDNANSLDAALRLELAAKAFAYSAAYDEMVAAYLTRQVPGTDGWPTTINLQLRKRQVLRYGENPHQRAAFYVATEPAADSLAAATQLQGKALSFNNLADTDTALECVMTFVEPACAIVKHANPCGVGMGSQLREAYEKAYATDPTSAFGGIIAFNRMLDAGTAAAILDRQFVEVVIAPGIDDAAQAILTRKRDVRVLSVGSSKDPTRPFGQFDLKSVSGGVLVQDRDGGRLDRGKLRCVTARAPTTVELDDLLFAWQVVKFVKSNAIVYAGHGRTLGIGAGQMSRVYSARLGAMKARDEGLSLKGSVLASDAFFPFRDGIDAAAGEGVTAVIQPGGSIRDAEIIAAADEHGLAMVFTDMRHFRH